MFADIFFYPLINIQISLVSTGKDECGRRLDAGLAQPIRFVCSDPFCSRITLYVTKVSVCGITCRLYAYGMYTDVSRIRKYRDIYGLFYAAARKRT